MIGALARAALAELSATTMPRPTAATRYVLSLAPGVCRLEWVSAACLCRQESSCGRLTNHAQQTTLKYDCTCASNHSAPGLQYYAGTIPTNICNMLYQNCIAGNTDNAQEQNKCKPNIGDLCGTLAPGSAVVVSSTAAQSSKPAATQSGASQSGSAATASSKAFAAPTTIPLGAAAIAGVFAYML